MRCVIVAKSPIEGWRSSILPVTVSGRTCYRPPAFAPRMTLGAARRSPSTAAGRGQKEIRGIRKKWPSEQQSFCFKPPSFPSSVQADDHNQS
jgi:hypothetical protein